MRVLVLIATCLAISACYSMNYPPTPPQPSLQELMAAEERAIFAATTAEEAALHKARWDVYARYLNMSIQKRAQRKAKQDEWMRRALTPVEHGPVEPTCSGHIDRNGFFQVQCD